MNLAYQLINEVPIVFLDVETTGLQAGLGHRVVELAALRYENGVERGGINLLLNPQKPIDYKASKISGITNQMIKNQPQFHFISRELNKLLKDAVIVAHNAKFDSTFLAQEFRIINLHHEITNSWLCTMELARSVLNMRSVSLRKVAERFLIPVEKAHRALNDVQTTKKVFDALVNYTKATTFAQLAAHHGGFFRAPTLRSLNLHPVIEKAIVQKKNLSIFYLGNTGESERVITPIFPTEFRGKNIYCLLLPSSKCPARL